MGAFFLLYLLMAKKVDIGSKAFTKLLDPNKEQPNKTTIKKIDAKMFSLDQNKVFSYKPEHLAHTEFERCLSLFTKRNNGQSISTASNRLAGIQAHIIKLEQPAKDKLQQLAIETIKEIYQVPDYVDLKGMIQPRLNLDTEQDKSPEPFLNLSLEQKNNMRDEIQKRIILNGLVHGSSMHIWKGIYHMVSNELEQINPDLKELYNLYTSTLGILIWLVNPDEFQKGIDDGTPVPEGGIAPTQGFNKVKFNRQKGFGGQVEAQGVNFPVLLHELNKGVLDWLISAGIPKSYTREELTYYYSKADSYENELWHYLLAPTLWADLLEVAKMENENIPKLINHLTKLSYPELVSLFRQIQDNKEKATQTIQTWNL